MAPVRERRSAGARVTGKFIKTEALRRIMKQATNRLELAAAGWSISCGATTISKTCDPRGIEVTSGVRWPCPGFFLLDGSSKCGAWSYLIHAIGNMDKTPIWIDMPGSFKISFLLKKKLEYNIPKMKYLISIKSYLPWCNMHVSLLVLFQVITRSRQNGPKPLLWQQPVTRNPEWRWCWLLSLLGWNCHHWFYWMMRHPQNGKSSAAEITTEF